MAFNAPIFFTLLRLIVSPVLLPILFVYLIPLNNIWTNAALACLFLAFGFTDFLDGYLARYLKQTTLLGKVLDPMADKFLTCAALIALLAVQKIFFVWVLVFIVREFFVLGLRVLALEHSFSLPGVWLSKVKTAVQMAYVALVIANPYHAYALYDSVFNQLEYAVLGIALVITVWTGYLYYIIFVSHFPPQK